ncbi:hypothetical protein BGZ61DRAFT_443516 [Ilyonectria robusta]|uniref:uncharacterized protein n=1 Tax=Ilyonectria robusta TaxID=1079257 RepID=UPI001E8DFF42|nr:uncharacterized protein BGZ61DRAFT_443516 [Ilyonectria robusta]KAH8734988.1 hypothetical protein BGZ61DRAFT_443516 [Ilyonectria robusta]
MPASNLQGKSTLSSNPTVIGPRATNVHHYLHYGRHPNVSLPHAHTARSFQGKRKRKKREAGKRENGLDFPKLTRVS